jgi:hypothetical protein
MIRAAFVGLVVFAFSGDAFAVLPVRQVVGTPLTKTNLAGIYLATLTLPGAPPYRAEIRVAANGTYTFRDQNPAQTMPAPGCSGRWTFRSGKFTGNLNCSAVGGPAVRQVLHLRGVTMQALKSTGAQVTVVSSFYGNSPMPFNLKRVSRPVFKK